MPKIAVGVSIIVDGTEAAVKVMDVLRNPLLGLALEGFVISQSIMPIDSDDEPELGEEYDKRKKF